jgi:hypothetical protein
MNPTGWVGAIIFASVVMVITGTFGAIEGLYAIFEDQVFTVQGGEAVLIDITGWGWLHLLLGLLTILVGYALFRGQTWARVMTIVMVMINATAHMLFLPVYPIGAIIIIALDMLVLWAVTFHGNEMRMK